MNDDHSKISGTAVFIYEKREQIIGCKGCARNKLTHIQPFKASLNEQGLIEEFVSPSADFEEITYYRVGSKWCYKVPLCSGGEVSCATEWLKEKKYPMN